MLLDSAQLRPFGATVTWVAWARSAATLAGRLAAASMTASISSSG